MASRPMAPDEVDAAFLALRYTRALDKLGPRLLDPDYWRELNPELTVSLDPLGLRAGPCVSGWVAEDPYQTRLREEGYFLSPPIVPIDLAVRLSQAVERIVARGLPPGCALMYDEFYQVYAGVLSAVAPILGPNPLLLPQDFWVFLVPPGDGASSFWTAFPPHKDWLGLDPGVMAGESPTVLVAWVSLSDASTDDSCIYVVPADAEQGYPRHERRVPLERCRPPELGAWPARAGRVLVFSTHLSTWGGRSSRWCTHGRVSISMIIQRGDVPQKLADVVDFSKPLPVETRARWMLGTLRMMIGKDQSEAFMQRAGLNVPVR